MDGGEEGDGELLAGAHLGQEREDVVVVGDRRRQVVVKG